MQENLYEHCIFLKEEKKNSSNKYCTIDNIILEHVSFFKNLEQYELSFKEDTKSFLVNMKNKILEFIRKIITWIRGCFGYNDKKEQHERLIKELDKRIAETDKSINDIYNRAMNPFNEYTSINGNEIKFIKSDTYDRFLDIIMKKINLVLKEDEINLNTLEKKILYPENTSSIFQLFDFYINQNTIDVPKNYNEFKRRTIEYLKLETKIKKTLQFLNTIFNNMSSKVKRENNSEEINSLNSKLTILSSFLKIINDVLMLISKEIKNCSNKIKKMLEELNNVA
jgi:hypothetical protein